MRADIDTVQAGGVRIQHFPLDFGFEAGQALAGIDGIAMGLVNGLLYLPYIRDEVLPRLAKLGLRAQGG